jgi:hypothetical protein
MQRKKGIWQGVEEKAGSDIYGSGAQGMGILFVCLLHWR